MPMLYWVTQVCVGIKYGALSTRDTFVPRNIVKWFIWRTKTNIWVFNTLLSLAVKHLTAGAGLAFLQVRIIVRVIARAACRCVCRVCVVAVTAWHNTLLQHIVEASSNWTFYTWINSRVEVAVWRALLTFTICLVQYPIYFTWYAWS